MFLSMIIKTIPRSPRALLALIVMLGSVSLLLSALTELFAPNNNSPTMSAVKFGVGLAIGLPATVVFYYWQHLDQTKSHEIQKLEVLDRYAEAEKRQRVYKQNTASPAYPPMSATSPPPPVADIQPQPTRPPANSSRSG